MPYSIKEKAFAWSALIPLLGFTSHPPSLTLLLYTVFVVYYFWERRKEVCSVEGAHWRDILTAAFVALLCTETLAWLDNFLIGFANPGALFHTQYLLDLLIGSGYYLGLAGAWYWLVRRYAFSLPQAFVTCGVLGVVLEQKGIVVVQAAGLLFANPVAALFVVGYVFLVHGAILGIIHLRMRHLVTGQDTRKRKYVVAIPLMVIGVVVGTVLSWSIAQVVSPG